MELFRRLPEPAQYLIFLLFLYWVYTLWRNHRRAEMEYREIVYQADDKGGSAAWRWVSPPVEVGLQVEQSDTASTIFLRPVRSGNEVIFSIFGLAFAAITLYSLATALTHLDDPTSLSPGMLLGGISIMAGFSYLLFCVDAPVTAITRTEDRIVLEVRRAASLHIKVVYRRKQAERLVFAGKIQGVLSMNIDQLDRLPDYYLMVKRRFYPPRLFLLRCTPSQGSWLVGGLNQWSRVKGESEGGR